MKTKQNFLTEQIDRYTLETNMDEINRSNDFYSDMFSLDFDSDFSTIDFESFSHFVIDTINW